MLYGQGVHIGYIFEDQENPVEWQEHVLKETHEMGLHLVVEAQAHMCKPEKLEFLAKHHPGCTVAIGLEAYDDAVLRFHVNKGFSTKTWRKAVEDSKQWSSSQNLSIFKPPFMSEGDALNHTSKWLVDVAHFQMKYQ